MKQFLVKNNIYIVLVTLLIVFLFMIYTIIIHKKNTQIFFNHNDQINIITAINNDLNSYIQGNSEVTNFDTLNKDIIYSLESLENLKIDAVSTKFKTDYIKILDELLILFNEKSIWLERFKARKAANKRIISIILDRSYQELKELEPEVIDKLNNIRIDILESLENKGFYNIDIVKHYSLEFDMENKFIKNFIQKVEALQQSINFQLEFKELAMNSNINTLLKESKQLLLKQREIAQNRVYLTLNILFVLVAIFLTLFALLYRKLIASQKQLQNLTYQSKLASMGEMISNIAHQWRQPLTHISYLLMNLKTAYEKNLLTPEYFDKKANMANAQIKYLSNTIDDFRDFFRNTNDKETFNLNDSIKEVINLLKDSFNHHNIEVESDLNKEILVKAYRGEFLQVIFNILNNAKDEFLKRKIENPKITIKTSLSKGEYIIKISDNAGGIKKELLQKVFEPYFTTKDKGLGIGLYMSKIIIEKIEGKLEAENIKGGALFIIKLKK